MLASVPSRKYRTRLWPMFISRPVNRGSVAVWLSPRLVVSRSVLTMPSRRAQVMSGHHLLVDDGVSWGCCKRCQDHLELTPRA
jgi:hypothetical protein